ncbi:hypothetical protein DPM19_29190 [Actinomadura craniellae]|uniref:Uncharacterized protein n=1 Tax=Actinomadura craniellae TaxID=2231787 RepID=A0A365GXY9_9ACTN|nr:hypothetical protein [Actinomadura craniellae]RAY11697.1 hypothetical protein DPM19_29190 [Actinomadura craniellae]
MADTSDIEELERLPAAELHDRALRLARERRDVGFVWDLLRQIPAANAATGDLDRAKFDILHGLALLDELRHADEGPLAEALRPVYVDYLAKHS